MSFTQSATSAVPESVEPRKVFATYERKINDGDYGSETASVIIQGDVPVGADDGVIEQVAIQAFQLAKVTVLDQLGRSVSTDAQGRIVEGGAAPAPQAQPSAPIVTTAQVAPTQAPQAAPITEAQAVQNVTTAFPGAQAAPAAPAGGGTPACPQCGGAMWDNRAKKASGDFKANGPDFACKNRKDGCEGVIWPS